MVDFLIYTQAFCPKCLIAKNILNEKNLSFKEKLIVDENGEKTNLIKEFREKTNHAKSLPQIFDLRNKKEIHIGDQNQLREYIK